MRGKLDNLRSSACSVFSTPDITHTLPLYIKHRLPPYVKLHIEPRQLGLIGARLAGAKAATGDAIIILDSHCEATEVGYQLHDDDINLEKISNQPIT